MTKGLLRGELRQSGVAFIVGFAATWAFYLGANETLDRQLRNPLVTDGTDLVTTLEGKGVKAAAVRTSNVLLYGADVASWRDAWSVFGWLGPYLPSPVRDKEWILASLLELVPKEAVARESDRVMLLETFSRELDGKDRTGPLEKLRTSSTVFMFRRYINGGIQFLTVWAFFSGMFLVLAVHVPQAAREHAVITKITRRLAMDGGAPKLVEDAGENGLLAADAPEGALSPSGARDLRDALRKLNEQDASAVVETLAAASHTFAVTTAVQEASRTLERSTGGLRDGLDSRHAYLRYIAWAIPSLGFIGTIVGIGNALDNAHRVVTTSGGETYQQEGAIQAITAQLGVAFDTTLVALLASLVLMLCIYLVGRYEDRWVERLSTAGDRLLTWFDGSRLEELLSQAIGEKIKSQNLELNKAVITEALREHQAELGQIAVGRKKP